MMSKEKSKRKMCMENRGITLIALVITIIVLLILAGITIAALSGDNGILTRAKEAKEKTQQSQKEEEKTLSNMENILNNVTNFNNINIEDTNPAGAIPTNVTILENDANNGIVIKDKNNNEWVWVEVPKTTVFADLTIDTTGTLTEQNYTDIKNKLIAYAGVYRNGSASQTRSDWKDEWYAKDGSTLVTVSTSNLTEAQKALTNGCGLTSDEYTTAYQKMLKSVYTYGGFWIGRYEAGIEGTTETTNARTSHSTVTIGTSPKAISQKDVIPYNYVYCSEAQALAKEMTPNSNYTSSLMFGIQWGLVCKYLEVKGKLTTANINSDSSAWGNYYNVGRTISSNKAKQATNNGGTWTTITGTKPASNVLLTAGASEETNKMNIYDFAGNEWEWTLEKTSDSYSPCASRGGGYSGTGSSNPASCRNNGSTTDSYNVIGFRGALYK